MELDKKNRGVGWGGGRGENDTSLVMKANDIRTKIEEKKFCHQKKQLQSLRKKEKTKSYSLIRVLLTYCFSYSFYRNPITILFFNVKFNFHIFASSLINFHRINFVYHNITLKTLELKTFSKIYLKGMYWATQFKT